MPFIAEDVPGSQAAHKLRATTVDGDDLPRLLAQLGAEIEKMPQGELLGLPVGRVRAKFEAVYNTLAAQILQDDPRIALKPEPDAGAGAGRYSRYFALLIRVFNLLYGEASVEIQNIWSRMDEDELKTAFEYFLPELQAKLDEVAGRLIDFLAFSTHDPTVTDSFAKPHILELRGREAYSAEQTLYAVENLIRRAERISQILPLWMGSSEYAKLVAKKIPDWLSMPLDELGRLLSTYDEDEYTLHAALYAVRSLFAALGLEAAGIPVPNEVYQLSAEEIYAFINGLQASLEQSIQQGNRRNDRSGIEGTAWGGLLNRTVVIVDYPDPQRRAFIAAIIARLIPILLEIRIHKKLDPEFAADQHRWQVGTENVSADEIAAVTGMFAFMSSWRRFFAPDGVGGGGKGKWEPDGIKSLDEARKSLQDLKIDAEAIEKLEAQYGEKGLRVYENLVNRDQWNSFSPDKAAAFVERVRKLGIEDDMLTILGATVKTEKLNEWVEDIASGGLTLGRRTEIKAAAELAKTNRLYFKGRGDIDTGSMVIQSKGLESTAWNTFANEFRKAAEQLSGARGENPLVPIRDVEGTAARVIRMTLPPDHALFQPGTNMESKIAELLRGRLPKSESLLNSVVDRVEIYRFTNMNTGQAEQVFPKK